MMGHASTAFDSMRSFRARILALVLGMIIVVLAATVVSVVLKARAAVEREASDQLRAASITAREVLRFRGNQLSNAAEVLSADFGFKEAIANGDTPTLASALASDRRRVGADLLIALDPAGRPLASTGASLSAAAERDFEALVAADADHQQLRLYRSIDGRPYQLVISPVLAPDPIGWAAIGFALDARAAADLSHLLGVQVSFVSGRGPSSAVSASSLPSDEQPPLRTLGARPAGSPFMLRTPNDDLLTWVDPIRSANAPLSLVLQRSLAGAMQPFHQLRDSIAVVGLTILVLGSLLAAWLARSATRPLSELTLAAERLEAGDYAACIPSATTTELARLASAFNAMRAAVAEREQKIRHQASHDPLTGLAARSRITEILDALLRAARSAQSPVSVCLIELQQLDDIVGSLGHAAGDEVVKELARRLSATVASEERVARLGTDRFVALLEGVCQGESTRQALALASALRAPFDQGAVCLQIETRLGVAVFPQEGASAAELLQRAELALFRGRETAAPVGTYRQGDDEVQRQRLAILGDLRRAVAANELELHYQPKLRLADERASGCEALLRWRHPEHGFVPPSDFIPHAERTDLIRPLTAWVLGEAMRQAHAWHGAGWPIEVAVNISPANLADPDFVDGVERALRASQVDPTKIVLEITEGAAMRDVQNTQRVMERLRILGLRFSIDDFGTGYSSLVQLQRLQVDELKIDRTFVQNLESRADDEVLVRSTINLAHALHLKVVAEGVEQRASLEVLRTLGCDLVQGYLIAKPMAAGHFTAWLRERDESARLTPRESASRKSVLHEPAPRSIRAGT